MEKDKFGARVFQVSDLILLVKQTVKSGSEQNAPYVIDEQKERHVDFNNDAEIAKAVRDAVRGELTS